MSTLRQRERRRALEQECVVLRREVVRALTRYKESIVHLRDLRTVLQAAEARLDQALAEEARDGKSSEIKEKP